MKLISEKPRTAGTRRVIIDLDAAEYLLVIKDGAFYKLGQPVDDVVGSHIITNCTQVVWCSAAQQWVEA